MSTTTLQVNLQLLGKEVFTEAEAPAANNEQRILYTGKKGLSKKNYNATSTPKVDGSLASREITLTAALTLDFAALVVATLPNAVTRTLDFSGKRLKWFFFRAATGNNAAGITIAPGASNPYPIFGAAKSVILGKGRIECGGFEGVESDLAIVAGGAKTIDITPGASDDVLYVEFHFGTTP